MRHIRAKSIYPGRIRGIMMEYRRERFVVEEKSAVNPRVEYRQFRSALKSAQQQLAGERKMMLDRRKHNPGEILAIDDAIDVLESHLMTLEDPYFLGEIKNRIFNTGATAAASLGAVISMVSRQFSFDAPRSALDGKRQNSHFLKDMSDMKRRILFFMGLQQELRLPEGISIIAAQKLTVSEVLALKRAGVRGIVIGQTSETAHELVMLRAMRIPCVSVSDARFFRLKREVPVLLDADIGYIVLKPRRTARFTQSGDASAQPRWSLTARMRSGEKAELSGTLHFISEIKQLKAPGEGMQRIGLYRTEYQVNHEMPSTRQLTKQYEYLLGEHPELDVTFRLFDFSDDKNFLKNAAIENDRDLRGVRFLLHERKMLESQLTALIKAAHETGRTLNLLIPYLSEFRELTAIRQMLATLTAGRKQVRLRLGGMLENAAAVLGARRLAPLLDFFYVGTSDLLSAISQQRRENTEAIHRALLSDAFVTIAAELKKLARTKPLSICGEIAGEPWAIAYLASFGFKDFVLPTHRIPIAQNMLQAMSRNDAVQYAKLIMRLDDETERLETARSLALEILYGQS